METIQAIEISITLFFQQLGEWLFYPMRIFSLLGDREFYLLLAPILYWCIDPAIGIRFGLYYMVSGIVNLMLKFVFQGPRPFWIDSRVTPKITEMTFGIPSGHAQNAVVVFGSLTRSKRLRLSWLWVILLSLFIGLSRIYLGVHFTSDVLFGWLFGALILWLALRWEDRFIAWFSTRSRAGKYSFVIIASVVVLLLGGFFHLVDRDRMLPEAWAANIFSSTGIEEHETPYSLANLISLSGAFLGLSLGAVWLFNHGGFQTQAHPMRLVLRYAVGLIGVVAIYLGLETIFPQDETAIALMFRYIRYAILGTWISAIAPALFKRISL